MLLFIGSMNMQKIKLFAGSLFIITFYILHYTDILPQNEEEDFLLTLA